MKIPGCFSKPLCGAFCFWLLFAAGACMGADDHFQGSVLPVPPAQEEKWTAPEGADPALAEVTQLVFKQGMADPRGCEYRQVKIATGSLWGHWDGVKSTMQATVVQTHAWVFDSGGQHFAVCWNGLVYPVLAVGDPCDLEKDVEAQLKPLDENQDKFMRGFYVRGISVPEEISTGFATPLAVNGAMLLRLGRGDLAAKVWKTATTEPTAPDQSLPGDTGSIYSHMAGMWLCSWYNRAVCAWMRSDDKLALADLKAIAPLIQEAKQSYAKFAAGAATGHPQDGDPFEFLEKVPDYVADMERRAKEAPRTPALVQGRDKFPDKAAWIKALIVDLEDVYAPQDGQPGWPMLDQNATIKALAAEGNDAVEPLLDCVEHDTRYTRTVHFWRDFAPNRTMIGTHEAAYAALVKIFGESFHDITSTSQDLTNDGPGVRAQVVAKMRAYWEKRKGTPVEEQWFITLADDKAKPEEWADAALNIVKSPGALRAKKNPGVTDLLKKRIVSLEEEKMSGVIKTPAVLVLLEALTTWDREQSDYALGVYDKLAANYLKEPNPSQFLVPALAGSVRRLYTVDDAKILAHYTGWLRLIPPEKVTSGFNGKKAPWFMPVWERPKDETLRKTAEFLFTAKNSPWRTYIYNHLGDNDTLDMLRSPLIGVPAFRQLLLTLLDDTAQAGESGFLDTDFWIVRYGDPKTGEQVMSQLNPLDPLAKDPPRNSPFRVCDLCAWALSRVEGMPAIEFYWPVEKRDAAIHETVRVLKQYGARFEVTSANKPGRDLHSSPNSYSPKMWFPKLTHVATQSDVDGGMALFALPADAKTRQWEMPSYPLNARWTAYKEYASNTGHGDFRGRRWTTTGYKNDGRVWQAEEQLVDGKWLRFYGFTGDYHIGRAPAEEIEFPAKWSWEELENGFDCTLDGRRDTMENPLHAGESLAITVKLRNRRGIDLEAPSALSKDDGKALADGVQIHVYRKYDAAAGEIRKEPAEKPTSPMDTSRDWPELTPKGGKIAHFPLPPLDHTLVPTAEIDVITCKLDELFDLTQPGEYYVNVSFDGATLKFTNGVSQDLQFRVK